MKIAIVAPEVFPVPPVRGGAVETVIEEVSARLAPHEVHIFGIADAALPLQETQGRRTYYRWQRTWLDRLLLCSWKLPFKQSNSGWYYWPYARWVARHVARLSPDVVWVHSRVHFAPWLRRAAPRARMIVSVHQLSTLRDARVWQAAPLACCDVITGVSRFMTEAIIARYPSTHSKARVLPNGVSVEAYQPWWTQAVSREQLRRARGLGEGPVILYAGRLVEQKGVHVLAEAFQRLQRATYPGPPFTSAGTGSTQRTELAPTLVIAGGHTYSDVTETEYIGQLKRQLQPLGSQVVWTGYVPAQQLTDWYAASDIVVVPSIEPESFSMVTLEAMAMGLPVVAFAHGGPCELIRHGLDGMLVEPAHGAQGLSEALGRLMADATLRQQLGRAARQRVEEQFTWQHVAASFLQIANGRPAIQNPTSKIENAMRILIAESGSGYGGSAKYLSELVSLLDRGCYDVRVLAAAEGPFIQRIAAQGVPVTLQPSWNFTGEQWGRFLIVPVIALWLSRRQIQLVHLNNEILSHVPLLLAAKLAGCRVVCHLHGWRPLTTLERWAARFVDQFVCISDAGARYHAQQLGRQVAGVPNGILLNGQLAGLQEKRSRLRHWLDLSEHDIAVTIVGRLVPWKGHETYLAALAQAAQQYPNISGLIVGRDDSAGQRYLAQLRQHAQALGIASRVRFIGWQEDVWSVYAASDVVVHASTQPEPFGLVLLEALAAGRPVIATRAGGVVDVVQDGETGLLVPSGDAEEMARAMRRLIEDRPLADRLARAGQARVRSAFTMERNATQVAAVYDRFATCPL